MSPLAATTCPAPEHFMTNCSARRSGPSGSWNSATTREASPCGAPASTNPALRLLILTTSSRQSPATAIWRRSPWIAATRSMPCTPRPWSWEEATKAPPGCAAKRDRRPSMARTSATSTAISWRPFASVRPPDRCRFLMEATVILNRNKRDQAEVMAALARVGINARIEAVEGSEIEETARAAVEKGASLIIVGGGDGSVSSAAQALVGRQATLAILPLGTLNQLARDLGVPPDLDQAAAMIAAGEVRAIDVAEVNERLFVNNA